MSVKIQGRNLLEIPLADSSPFHDPLDHAARQVVTLVNGDDYETAVFVKKVGVTPLLARALESAPFQYARDVF